MARCCAASCLLKESVINHVPGLEDRSRGKAQLFEVAAAFLTGHQGGGVATQELILEPFLGSTAGFIALAAVADQHHRNAALLRQHQ